MSEADRISLLGGKLRLIQPIDGFRPGLDAVMLAAACPARENQTILDLGCGAGAAGLCVLARIPKTCLTGIDIQEKYIALARQNAALNGMKAQADFLCEDVKNLSPSSRRKPGSSSPNHKIPDQVRDDEFKFDHVICNPPYDDAEKHVPSPLPEKALARSLKDTALEDWIACAFAHIAGRGSLTLIHRAGMTDKILQTLGRRFGGTEILPLWPRAGEPARRVVIRTWKHKKAPARLHPGLVLHAPDGAYTPEAEKILREGALL